MASARFVPPESSLGDFVEEQTNKDTLSKTKRDVLLLKEFMRTKGKDEEFENIEPRELDEILCAFILAVKKRTDENMNHQHYGHLHPALTAIYGRKKGYTTETLVAKQKELKTAGKGKKTKAASALLDEEVDVLYRKELFGLSSPESLLNTLWLNNTQHSGLRRSQEHRNMKWGDAQLQTWADWKEILEHIER